MSQQSLRVIFDGEVLRPQEPIDLERGRYYRVTIEDETPPESTMHEPGVLDDLLQFSIDTGIEDFAEQLHHYLHGAPKR
jgi:hypothetical protein